MIDEELQVQLDIIQAKLDSLQGDVTEMKIALSLGICCCHPPSGGNQWPDTSSLFDIDFVNNRAWRSDIGEVALVDVIEIGPIVVETRGLPLGPTGNPTFFAPFLVSDTLPLMSDFPANGFSQITTWDVDNGVNGSGNYPQYSGPGIHNDIDPSEATQAASIFISFSGGRKWAGQSYGALDVDMPLAAWATSAEPVIAKSGVTFGRPDSGQFAWEFASEGESDQELNGLSVASQCSTIANYSVFGSESSFGIAQSNLDDMYCARVTIYPALTFAQLQSKATS